MKIELLNRVIMISEMVNETLEIYKEDEDDFNKWRKENPDKRLWEAPTKRTNPTEIKRLMLILRKETVKLEKLL